MRKGQHKCEFCPKKADVLLRVDKRVKNENNGKQHICKPCIEKGEKLLKINEKNKKAKK